MLVQAVLMLDLQIMPLDLDNIALGWILVSVGELLVNDGCFGLYS